MQKALLATTALVLSAGVAAADVTISGYGRTGIIYYENDDPDLDDAGWNETRVVSRLRMNLDASTETDAGVEFGARFRLQWDQGDTNTASNPAKLWVSAQGLTVEVGNVDTAIDSSSLIYATELGAFDRSVGFSDVTGDFYAYSAKNYGLNLDRVGVAAAYSFGDLTVRASYVNPDQSGVAQEVIEELLELAPGELDGTFEKEIGLLAEYKWDNRLELSAAYTQNGAGIDDNNIFFVGARYAVADNARVGLNYVSTKDWMEGDTFALYGDYTLADGLTNIEGYVAHNDLDDRETKNAFGLGVNYDLGGARLGASIQRDYDKLVTADMGVRFNF